MGRIAGIIYPNLLQVGKIVLSMLKVQESFNEDWIPFIYTHETVQLGQTGTPLTFNLDQSLMIALDGSIFNQKELRQTLNLDEEASLGEIFLKAYEQFKFDFLKKIDGDFAFALYDVNQKKLILGRDRLGKKPLYWFQSLTSFLFASELKGLMVTGIVPQTLALDGIASYLALGYFPQDQTPIQGVNKLLPGYYLVLEKNSSIHIRSYWSLSHSFSKETQDSKEQIVEKLKKIIDASIEKRLTDQSIGCFMSSGFGSASIALKLKNRAVNGYISGFIGKNDEMIESAKIACDSLGLDQAIDLVTPSDFIEDLISIVWQLDEPLADPNIVVAWHLAKMSKTSLVFSGLGSDEMLTGYNQYTFFERHTSPFDQFFNQIKRRLRQAVVPFLIMIKYDGAFKYLKQCQVNPHLEQYVVQNQLFSFKNFNFLTPEVSKLFDPSLFLQKFHNISLIPSISSACAYLDVKTRLPDQAILPYDRFCSAFGLNWMTPYLDKDLIEYAASIPEMEEGDNYLSDLFQNDFPQQFSLQAKKITHVFINDWVNSSQMHELFPLLKNGTLVNTGLISKSWVKRMCENRETMESAFRYLFCVFILELWFRLYINRPFTLHPPKLSVRDLLLEP